MISYRSAEKKHQKLNLTVQTSYSSLHSQRSKKQYITVITPSNKPTRKNKTIKQIKLQVTATKQTTILPIQQIVKDKQAFTKEEGLIKMQRWQAPRKLQPKSEPVAQTTIGADSVYMWIQPETPISKLISEKHFFKQ